MVKLKVLGICGSLRADSYNRKLLHLAKRIAVDLDAEVSEADLKEFNLPIYDGDIEAKSFPKPVQKLKVIVELSDVILIASPEYNYSIPGGLKNAIDWLSRGGNSFDKKVVAIFGASPGRFGTAHGQCHLRQVFTALNAFVLPQPEVFIGQCAEVFDANGSLKDEKTRELLRELIQKTFEFAINLK